MPNPKPHVTGTTHTLAFQALSAKQFEELSLWLTRAEGYPKAEYYGVLGNDGGCDILDRESGTVFQCKNTNRFASSDIEKEVQKIRQNTNLVVKRIVFIVRCDVTSATRDYATQLCNPTPCEFWSGKELDEKVKKHHRIVANFFGLPASPMAQSSASDAPQPAGAIDRVLGSLTLDRSGKIVEGHAHLAELITELILRFQTSSDIGIVHVHFEELLEIESKLRKKEYSSQLARRELEERKLSLECYKARIERGVRLVAIGGRNIVRDPDDLAKCAETVITKVMELGDLIREPSEADGFTIDLFTEGKYARHMQMRLSFAELEEMGMSLRDLQTPHSCARLPYDILRFRAFPLLVAATVWYEAIPDDDKLAAQSCDYDYWAFGLA